MLKFGDFILNDIKKAVLLYFHNFFKIKGRSARKEFLSTLIIYYIFNLFVDTIGNKIQFFQEYILMIILFISYFNVVVRRSHDLNISGWFFTVFTIISGLRNFTATPSILPLFASIYPCFFRHKSIHKWY